jgi:hypothetical protein
LPPSFIVDKYDAQKINTGYCNRRYSQLAIQQIVLKCGPRKKLR